jgi:hypothetical protein
MEHENIVKFINSVKEMSMSKPTFLCLVVVFLIVVCFLLLCRQSTPLPPQEPKREVHVLGLQTCGLGNNLCQLATAIHYARNYNGMIVLNSGSDGILWGTSRLYRDRIEKNADHQPVPYTNTIFSRLPHRSLTPTTGPTIERFFYEYDGPLRVPQPDTTTLQIEGLCQNKDLYEEVIPYLPFYLDLEDTTRQDLLWKKYGLHRDQTHNVMISLRIGLDFAHMVKVNHATMKKAIQVAVGNEPYRLVVISDNDDIGEWRDVLKGYSFITVVEDDITQFYAGLCCSKLILGESTYHYWIALCRMALFPEQTQVYVFRNTDLTNRNLSLDAWTRLDLA